MIEYSNLTSSPWVSKPIHIKSFFQMYSDKLPSSVKVLQSNEDSCDYSTMSSIMGIQPSHEQFQELISYCAEDKLDILGEPPLLSNRNIPARNRLFDRTKLSLEGCDLETLKNVKKGKDLEYNQFLKYTRCVLMSTPENSGRKDLSVNKDIIITIRVHDSIYPQETCTTATKHMSQEISVLGHQYLCELRDKIYCATDYTTPNRGRDNLSETPKRAKDVFKSGFIFIEDIFYNDFRNKNNIDYSEGILKWAKTKKIDGLTKGSLTETKFEDLTVRFGFPYLYRHQGNCEHLIVFSDASLLHETDAQHASSYPLYKSVGRKSIQQCMICCHFMARWITFENERVPVDPYYFCDKCFKSYNFIDGKKIGNFRYYEYFPYIPLSLPD